MRFYVLWYSSEIWPFSYWLNRNFSKTGCNGMIQWNMPKGIKSDGNKHRKLYNLQYKWFGCWGFDQIKQSNKITGDWITRKDHVLDLKTLMLLSKVCWIYNCIVCFSPGRYGSQGVPPTQEPWMLWIFFFLKKNNLRIKEIWNGEFLVNNTLNISIKTK